MAFAYKDLRDVSEKLSLSRQLDYGHVHTNWTFLKPHIFNALNHWRAILNQCSFSVRIHWFRVDWRLIHVKKYPVSWTWPRMKLKSLLVFYSMYNLVATKAATFSLSPRPFWYGFVQETFMLISRLIPKTVGRMESRGEIKHDRWEGGGGGGDSPLR